MRYRSRTRYRRRERRLGSRAPVRGLEAGPDDCADAPTKLEPAGVADSCVTTGEIRPACDAVMGTVAAPLTPLPPATIESMTIVWAGSVVAADEPPTLPARSPFEGPDNCEGNVDRSWSASWLASSSAEETGWCGAMLSVPLMDRRAATTDRMPHTYSLGTSGGLVVFALFLR